MWTIAYTDVATRELARLPTNISRRIVEKIGLLAADPYAPNNNVKRLKGSGAYRLRVGDWRVLYELEDEVLKVLVLRVGPRGSVYDD